MKMRAQPVRVMAVHCMFREFVCVCLLVMLVGCQTSTAQNAEIPAVLLPSFASARAEIIVIVADILHVKTVNIADDTLVNDSLMVIQMQWPRDAAGRPLSGRDFDRPELFQLKKIDDHCVLLQLRTGDRAILQHSQCKAQALP